jgi:hypothetical protein
MFSLARLFSYTRYIERELRRERVLRRRDQLRADRERQKLVDALARASNKPTVFDRPAPVPTPTIPQMAFGPTAIAAAEAQRQREEQEKILQRADEARRNGNRVSIPDIPNQ